MPGFAVSRLMSLPTPPSESSASGSLVRTAILAVTAMLAFAANSVLCRQALVATSIDAASFTTVRIVSGALTLFLLARVSKTMIGGSWLSALMLFVYAAGFSFAYLSLGAATGALLLFGAVQCTMIGWGYTRGDRINVRQLAGVALAVAGLVGLLLPGASAPPLFSALLMMAAGVAWGVYSLRGSGNGVTSALGETAGNFIRAFPLTLVVSFLFFGQMNLDPVGVAYSIASGALASGAGYAIWYMALPGLRASTAAILQLSVPVLTALGGAFLLAEPITFRVLMASLAILGGLAIFLLPGSRIKSAR